jgi:hypothetical protein
MTVTHVFAAIAVADLGPALAFDAGPVETLGSGARKAEVRDPEGNRISFGQA